MKSENKILIVTPTYNSEKYLVECIESIKNQRYKNYEHIIVDGGSTDKTIDIIKNYIGSYPMRYISEKDDGMYDAISKGFSLGTGDIMAWINSDDIYMPWTFEVVANAFEKRSDVLWITGIPSNRKKFGNSEINYLMPNLPPIYCNLFIKYGLYNGRQLPFIQQESCFWKKELWQRCSKPIDKRYKLAADYFLWKKFAEYTKIYTVHCNLATFRIHENQQSKNIEAYYNETGKKKNFLKIGLTILSHLYSLIFYKKQMLNINEIYKG